MISSLEKGKSGSLKETSLSVYLLAMDQLEAVPAEAENFGKNKSAEADKSNLYLDAALELTRLGLNQKALQTFERGIRRQAADMLALNPPVFKRERHKILMPNLRYLRGRLYDIRAEIVTVEETGAARSRLRQLRSKKTELENRSLIVPTSEGRKLLEILPFMKTRWNL